MNAEADKAARSRTVAAGDATPGAADVLMAQLEEGLRGVKRVRLLGSDWLACSQLGELMAPSLDQFCARGGHVELVKRP